jgi:hypothetical protein
MGRVELEPSAGALLEGPAELLAGGEAENGGDCAGDLGPARLRGRDPDGDAAAGEHAVPHGGEGRRLALDQLVGPYSWLGERLPWSLARRRSRR